MENREHAEHAQHAAETGDKLISRVTLTIAVLAVLAAIGASLETTEGDKAIAAKNDAVLAQNRASDQWGFYEAKSLKKNLYGLAADEGGPKAAAYAKTAAQNGNDQAQIQTAAKGFEAKRDEASARAETYEQRHGHLTIASTLLHMAIAIATLAIILGRKWPWHISMALGAVGMAIVAWVFL